MRALRPRLVGVAAALLLHQAAGLALVAGLACCADAGRPSAMEPMECCRTGGAGHICPLMTRDGERPAPCRVKSACTRDHSTGPATPFFACAAPVPDRVVVAAPPPHRAAWDGFSSRTLRADLPPPGPPPKA
jgi:hypothetical protein